MGKPRITQVSRNKMGCRVDLGFYPRLSRLALIKEHRNPAVV